MTRTLLKSKGASTIEYAVIVAVVVAGLICMQIYLKAALCGRWKAMADVFGGGQQYEPPSRAQAFGTQATRVE
jgi:Flp pilus assembly pilin Flp